MYATGADKSPLDVRTFSYKPTTANLKGGERYTEEFIDDQHRVGICTSISMTMNAGKALGKKFSPDFQYLVQKLYVDGNWNEGSSVFSACKTAHKYGLLPEEEWTYTDEADRKLPYYKYIKKLQAIPIKEISELLEKTTKIESYAKVPISRDYLANAISHSDAGLLVRFAIGEAWWTKPIEPLLPSEGTITGHAVSSTNYDGGSFRIANSWGTDWADKGTAYHLLRHYSPTEAYAVFYKDEPIEIINQKESDRKLLALIQLIIKIFRWRN